MTITARHRNDIDRRREAVADFCFKGFTIRKMAEELPKLNPPIIRWDGKHWGTTVIHEDICFLRNEWKEKAAADINEWKAEQIAILRRIQTDAINTGQAFAALQAHDRIANVLGLSAPKRTEITGLNGSPMKITAVRNMTDEQLERIIALAEKPAILGDGSTPGAPGAEGA